MSENRVVVGVLAGMEAKGSSGWIQYSIQEEGRQYPVKASTKKPELIAQCGALLGQKVRVLIVEQPSTNLNPNTGQPYTNRYLNEIAVAQPGEISSAQPTQQQAQPQAQGQPQASPAATRGDDSVRELRIMRMGASERAVQMAAAGLLGENATSEKLVAAAEVWVAYFVYGAARFGVQSFDSHLSQPGGGSDYNAGYAAQGAQQEPPQQTQLGDPGFQHSDDDIPF